MIVPTSRLMWLTGLVVVPALTLAGLRPAEGALIVVPAIALVLLAALDALRGTTLLDPLSAELPPVLRITRRRASTVPLRLLHAHCRTPSIRIALALPDGVESSHPILEFSLPQSPASLLEWPVRVAQRGLYHLRRCHVETTSPLGLWNLRRDLPVQSEIRVHPDLAAALRSNAAFLARALSGTHAIRQVGKGRDFEKLRDYVGGDSMDEIHWRATAKRGHPVTKIFQVERTQEVYVVIDASRLSGRILTNASAAQDREPVLEQFIQAALLLGSAAERQGDLFGLITFAAQVESFVRADAGPAHFGACREQLVTLHTRPVTPDFEELASFLRTRLRRRALLLFLTSLDDPVAAEGFLRGIDLIRRQHLCVVVQPRAPGVEPVFSHPDVSTVDDLHRALAGHIHWRTLRDVQSALQHRGVTLAMAPADGLAAALITRYLDVKKRQAL